MHQPGSVEDLLTELDGESHLCGAVRDSVGTPTHMRHLLCGENGHSTGAAKAWDLQNGDAPAGLTEPLEDLLADWTAKHRAACEAQIRMVHSLLEDHSRRILLHTELKAAPQGASACGGKVATADVGDFCPPKPVDVAVSEPAKPPPTVEAVSSKPQAATAAAATMQRQRTPLQSWYKGDEEAQSKAEAAEVIITEDDALLERWRRSSGMHTVEGWCKNYKKHPAGWGALLMIHGVAEVTGRLRSKVENFSIYSALFLSASIPLVSDVPNHIGDLCDSGDLECQISKRVFFYSLAVGIACHVLSILLAMAFVNTLNETARDSDVIRMFARGKGFLATVRCQQAFLYGCLAVGLAIVTAAKMSLGWEVVALSAACTGPAWYVLNVNAKRLECNASIVKYWREELGGKPDADDPYDLSLPVGCLRRRCTDFHENLAARVETTGGPK